MTSASATAAGRLSKLLNLVRVTSSSNNNNNQVSKEGGNNRMGGQVCVNNYLMLWLEVTQLFGRISYHTRYYRESLKGGLQVV